MYPTMFSRKVTTLLFIALVSLTILVTGEHTVVGEPQSPLRLQLKIERSTLRVGERTRLLVEFLDRNYRRVPNDRDRVIKFKQESAGSQQTGSGNLSPTQITLRRGMESSSEVTFEARIPGALMIRALTEELVPAQSLLVIVQRPPSRVSRLFNPSVYAQTNTFEVLPTKQDVVVRGAPPSSAVFWINLSRPLEASERISIGLRTNPADSEVMYKGQRYIGFMDITIEKRAPSDEVVIKSDEIHVLSSQPRTVRVVARIIPHPNTGGDQYRAEASVNFIPARPEKIILSADQERIPSDRGQAWLSLKLGDRDKVATEAFEGTHHIRLSSNNPEVRFDQENLVLSYPQRPLARPRLKWEGLPGNSQIHVTAEDQEGDLEHGEATITLESLIRKVVLNGLNGVVYGWREYPLTICLGGEGEKHHLPADCDRQIIVTASSGWLNERKHMIAKGQHETRAMYRTPILGGTVTVTVESPGLEQWKLEMRVITAASVLVLFAGLGGMLGGIIRHLYKEGVKRIWPNWGPGYLDPGLVGNALASFVIGLVLFQAVNLGLSKVFSQPTTVGDTPTFAFFFGVLGGYGGIVILDKLLDRILPGQQTGSESNNA